MAIISVILKNKNSQSGERFKKGGISMSPILMNILPIVLMLGLFYAIVFIPENKRRKKYSNMLQELKANDEVLTRGGIMGKVINIQEDFVIIESGPERSRLKISKQGIANVIEEKDKTIE